MCIDLSFNWLTNITSLIIGICAYWYVEYFLWYQICDYTYFKKNCVHQQDTLIEGVVVHLLICRNFSKIPHTYLSILKK